MKRSFFIIISYFSSTALYCSDNPEAVNFIPDREYQINNDGFFDKRITKCNYSCCPNTYKNYSCTERGCNALIGILPACCCLATREMITDCAVWSKNNSVTFMQAHSKMWCTKDAWLPCYCDTSKEVCTNTAVTCSTGITIASITYALCLFLPCITKKGCTLIKKKNIFQN